MTPVASSGTATVTLPADNEILIAREFAAPPHLVYRAWTTSELIKRWWSGKRGTVTTADVDLRVGGSWRYVMVANDGREVAFHGEFREIVENERLVNTEVYEGAPDGLGDPPVCVNTFTELADGRTLLEQLIVCPTLQVRDIIIGSGMESGMQESMDALEEVAISLA
jgi:uncharacterized protein YndB with AHSA1/START domain